MLTSDQRTVIKQAKLAYSHLRKAFEKQMKAIEDETIKQVKNQMKI